MRLSVDLSRPDIVYGLIWGAAFSLILAVQMDYMTPMQPEVMALIGGNILSFWLVYQLLRYVIGRESGVQAIQLPEFEIQCLSRFCKLLFAVWAPLYFLSIILSGGIPALWILIGDGRTYLDFGVPTFTGLLNMIRAFVFSVGILVFLNTRKRSALVLPAIMLLSGLAEVSRGNLTVMLLHGVGIYLLCVRRMFRILVFTLVLGGIFIYMFGALAEFRGGATPVEDLVADDSIFLSLPSGLFWVYTYLVSPLNNINYAYFQGIEPLMYPYYSLQPLVPTIIRNALFPVSEYPIQLAVEAFNATTYYSPLIADFGIIGAGIAVFFLQFITAYSHVKAKRGDIFHILVYPAFFMCVVMSIFYMFFFSMVVVLYPLLAMAYVTFRRVERMRQVRRQGLIAEQ